MIRGGLGKICTRYWAKSAGREPKRAMGKNNNRSPKRRESLANGEDVRTRVKRG